jgi:hypothetical protein
LSRFDQAGQLWLYRTKPQEDELLSSWLVRLAWGSAIKLQHLCVHVLGQSPGFLSADIDRNPQEALLAQLCESTGTPLARGLQIGLASLEGRLWCSFHSRGPVPWLIPNYRDGRRRLKHGLQYCPQCLAEDDQPYFRRKWRLAFNVVCERHGLFLRDECPHCAAPVVFHTGDFGRRLLSAASPITQCPSCLLDLRKDRAPLRPIPDRALVEFHTRLMSCLAAGHETTLPGASLYSFLFFDGLHLLCRLLVSSGRGGRLRSELLDGVDDALRLARQSAPVRFEELRLADRVLAMTMCERLISRWPLIFASACKRCRLSSSYVIRYDAYMPYWLCRELRWELNDRDYAPSEEERTAVTAYLQRHGLPAHADAVERLLGTRHAGQPAMPRWNPRGSHAR